MYPKLRFKGFDDAWEQRKFKDVGTVSMCKRIFKEETSEEGDIPFFKIGTFGGIPDAFISRELFDEYKSKYSYPEPGDILLSASGTIGRIVEYEGEEAYFQDSNIVWLSHDKSVDNKFLKVLYSIVKWDGIEGSTIKRLYNDNFLKTQFMLPSIEEQKKIGSFFEQLDNLITLHQRQCETLKKQKQFFLQNMFPKEGESSPKIRFKGFSDSWKQCKLHEICSMNARIGWQNLRTSEFLDSGDYLLITGTDFVNGKVNFKSCHYVDKYRFDQDLKIQVQNGSILITKDGTLGKVAIIESLPKPATLNAGVFNVVIKSKDIDNYYLYQYLKAPFLMNYVNKRSTGGTIKHLNQSILVDFPVLKPSLQEQQKIGAYFERLDNLITLHQRQYEQLVSLKKYLLTKMFI